MNQIEKWPVSMNWRTQGSKNLRIVSKSALLQKNEEKQWDSVFIYQNVKGQKLLINGISGV